MTHRSLEEYHVREKLLCVIEILLEEDHMCDEIKCVTQILIEEAQSITALRHAEEKEYE